MQRILTSISHRGLDIKASPIRSLLPYARTAIKNGKKIIHLNIGQPDIKTPESAMEHIRKIDNPIIKYGPSEGLPELRSAVADYYHRFQANLDSSNVYVTTGASEAILFTLLSVCDVGDEVIIPEPFYANYIGFAHISHVNIIPLTTSIEDEFALPPPEKFEKLITDRTKAIFLCNPGNPTGQLYDKRELDILMSIVEKHGLFLIVDEVYREFCYDKTFTSVLSYQGLEENVIVIDSISKVFSACGARVGYLISKNEDFLSVVNKYAQLRLCPPFFGQQLALKCYDNPDPYLINAKNEYRARRELLYNRLSNIKGIKSYKPSAAFYNMAALPVESTEAFCKWLLTDYEKDGKTVMLAAANGFYFNSELGKNQVRIAYILNEKDLSFAMDCLEEALSIYNS